MYLWFSTLVTGWMPTILRAGRGMTLWEKAKQDPPPEKLELFSYENNLVSWDLLLLICKGWRLILLSGQLWDGFLPMVIMRMPLHFLCLSMNNIRFILRCFTTISIIRYCLFPWLHGDLNLLQFSVSYGSLFQYARIVREALCELELPYILQNVGEGSPQERLLIDISGSKEVWSFT